MSHVDAFPLLMAILWYGFSLSFLVIAWIAWMDYLRNAASARADDSARQTALLSPALRWGIAILGLVGAFGAAGLVGLHREVTGVTWSFLIGVTIGTALAIVLRKHSMTSAHVANGQHPDA